MESALEPLSAQITDLEENIESIVRRNDIVDEEIQGIKSDMISLAEKILAIKVSSIYRRFSTSMEYRGVTHQSDTFGF